MKGFRPLNEPNGALADQLAQNGKFIWFSNVVVVVVVLNGSNEQQHFFHFSVHASVDLSHVGAGVSHDSGSKARVQKPALL